MATFNKSRRGFASMTAEQRRAIASLGGKAAHAAGRAHKFTIWADLFPVSCLRPTPQRMNFGNCHRPSPWEGERASLLIRGQVLLVGQSEAAALDKRLEPECDKVAALTRRLLGRVSIKDLAGK
jgi:hypothetical protein